MIQSPFWKSAALRFSGLTKPVLFAVFLLRLRGRSSGIPVVLVWTGDDGATSFSTADMILVQKESLMGRRHIHQIANDDRQKFVPSKTLPISPSYANI